MSIKTLYGKFNTTLDGARDLAPLMLRLLLAYGFWEPAWNKIQDVHAIGEWFESMELPAPYAQAWMATLTECLGVVLLVLGLGTRIIVVPLIITMIVAIKTVHWENGFSAGDNGWEIPFYYGIMLLCLLFSGSGKISVDYLISRRSSTVKPA